MTKTELQTMYEVMFTDYPDIVNVAQVQAIDPALSIHDFRVVAGPTHTNVIFDLELPYHFYLKEETVVQQLKDFISELEGHRYFAVIQVDHSYVGGAHKAPEKQEST